jgi:hypothetical protein
MPCRLLQPGKCMNPYIHFAEILHRFILRKLKTFRWLHCTSHPATSPCSNCIITKNLGEQITLLSIQQPCFSSSFRTSSWQQSPQALFALQDYSCPHCLQVCIALPAYGLYDRWYVYGVLNQSVHLIGISRRCFWAIGGPHSECLLCRLCYGLWDICSGWR